MSNFAPKDDNWDNDFPTPTFDVLSIHQSNGFCPSMSCPCHSDSELIGELANHYHNGLLTAEESLFIYRGRDYLERRS